MNKIQLQTLVALGYEGHAIKKGYYITYEGKKISPYFKTTKLSSKWANKNYKLLMKRAEEKGGER
jgi:hypothetical protein